jgi:predicted hydrocarbon binding protein
VKGSIFIALNEMVVEKYGLGTWLDIIDYAGVEGIYTSTQNYDDSELTALVETICLQLAAPADQVVRNFGEYLFDYLHKAHPVFANAQPDFFSFIDSIDGVIHVEVHKLDESANTPHISVKKVESDVAILQYQSPRKLCHLAEGLLLGAARLYGINIEISQPKCMHDGEESCELLIRKL